MPRGTVVHHKEENTLRDVIDNLELLTKADHLAEHRAGFAERRNAAFTEARRSIRWSTKSTTKRVGAPPKHTDAALAAARAALADGMNPHAVSKATGVSRTTCYRLQRGER